MKKEMNQDVKKERTGSEHISLEAGLVESLKELRDSLKNGEKLEERFTMRTVDLDLQPHDYEAEDIKRVREQLGASQSVFAQLLGVRPRTVQSWEQGMVPPAMARRLLDVIRENPAVWKDKLRNARKHKATNA